MTEQRVLESEVYVALGSNVDPARYIPAAVELLADAAAITGISRFYRTTPIGRPGQPDFINGVVRVRTSIAAQDFKWQVLRGIESQLGRTREEDRYAPRSIDLDILLYGEEIIDTPELVVPDPDISERGFLAQGIVDIAPGLVLPGSSQPLADCVAPFEGTPLEDLTDALRERWLGAASRHP